MASLYWFLFFICYQSLCDITYSYTYVQWDISLLISHHNYIGSNVNPSHYWNCWCYNIGPSWKPWPWYSSFWGTRINCWTCCIAFYSASWDLSALCLIRVQIYYNAWRHQTYYLGIIPALFWWSVVQNVCHNISQNYDTCTFTQVFLTFCKY